VTLQTRAAWLLAIYAFIIAGAAQAHGFGQRYDLPVPLWLYLTGAAATVAVSFAIMALFVQATPGQRGFPTFDLLSTRLGRALAARPVLFACRLLGVALYLLVVFAGLYGAQSPLKNIAPVMVWAIWWVGLAYVCALAGNLWALINPLDTLFRWAEAVHRRLRSGRQLSVGLRYPERLGVWPAVALFLAFVWMELVWEEGDVPASLAAAILGYSGLTWLGMFLFGRRKWLSRGEAFAIVFGLFARFGPTEVRVVNGRREWNLRPYSVGLLTSEPAHPSLIVLVVLMLAAVSFDGFIETPAWAAFVDALNTPAEASELAATPPQRNRGALALTLGLVAAPALFLAVYLCFCILIARFSGSETRIAAERIPGLFVLTLVPIAIAYHLAHYLSFLAMAAQYLVPLASDPFGWRWDLFGGTNYFITPGVVGARVIWYVSVAAIVAGHIAAVYLAHVQALREFRERQAALRSQYPMLVLMIGYTMTSLWIIAQPIVTAVPG
jgi:hypothetical protein